MARGCLINAMNLLVWLDVVTQLQTQAHTSNGKGLNLMKRRGTIYKSPCVALKYFLEFFENFMQFILIIFTQETPFNS